MSFRDWFFDYNKLELWVVDYVFKIDNGLWEVERENLKKFSDKTVSKKLNADRGYNQLQGKFHVLICLAQDFKVTIPSTQRLQARIKQHGGKTNLIERINKPFAKTRRVPKGH